MVKRTIPVKCLLDMSAEQRCRKIGSNRSARSSNATSSLPPLSELWVRGVTSLIFIQYHFIFLHEYQRIKNKIQNSHIKRFPEKVQCIGHAMYMVINRTWVWMLLARVKCLSTRKKRISNRPIDRVSIEMYPSHKHDKQWSYWLDVIYC